MIKSSILLVTGLYGVRWSVRVWLLVDLQILREREVLRGGKVRIIIPIIIALGEQFLCVRCWPKHIFVSIPSISKQAHTFNAAAIHISKTGNPRH